LQKKKIVSCLFDFWLRARLCAVLQTAELIVTRDAVSFPDQLAQYVLGSIVAHEQHLLEYYRNQQRKLWSLQLKYNLHRIAIL